MKVRYLSDLHLEFIIPECLDEFISNISPGQDDEICILAGDIGSPYSHYYDIFMNFISRSFKKTFVIAGNHEYYNKIKTIEETNKFLEQYFKKFDNISFLNNSFEYYCDFCFVGTTLWSKLTDPNYIISYRVPELDYDTYNQINQKCVDFLENTLKTNNNCVIITHHMPSNTLIDKKYKIGYWFNYNQWFFCDLNNLLEKYRNTIKCWVYGHTHIPSITNIYGIPFICNPIGYPGENSVLNFQKQFDLV